MESDFNDEDFFQTLEQSCVCTKLCLFEGIENLASNFRNMKEKERISTCRSIMLALSTPPNNSNKLRNDTRTHSQKKATSVFYLRGQPLCKPVFARVINLHENTITFHSNQVSGDTNFSLYFTDRYLNRKGKLAPQSVIASAFLNAYSDENSMPCPRGRGSQTEAPLRVLPSSTTKLEIYNCYKLKWNEISEAAVFASIISKNPINYLGIKQFCRVWDSYHPTLRISPKGSDFCDFCILTKQKIKKCRKRRNSIIEC